MRRKVKRVTRSSKHSERVSISVVYSLSASREYAVHAVDSLRCVSTGLIIGCYSASNDWRERGRVGGEWRGGGGGGGCRGCHNGRETTGEKTQMDYKHVEEVFLYAETVYPLFAPFPRCFCLRKMRWMGVGAWGWGKEEEVEIMYS